MSKLNYREIEKDMLVLDSEDLSAIEIKAKALTIAECFDFLCVEASEIPELDLKYANKAWRRGRAAALNTAAEKMFSAMGTRQGGPIAFEYLRELSDTFSVEALPTGKSDGGFQFNVIMPETES